jgi:hypothetical protein
MTSFWSRAKPLSSEAVCSNQARATCHCGKSSAERRCGTSAWSCKKLCGRRLLCGHRCPLICHPGPCQDCQLAGKTANCLISKIKSNCQLKTLCRGSFLCWLCNQHLMMCRAVQLPLWGYHRKASMLREGLPVRSGVWKGTGVRPAHVRSSMPCRGMR